MVRIRQEPRFNILRCHVWNHKISGEKALFSEFWDFLLIWASFKCYFLIPHLNIMPGTNCHENITSQTQIINVNAFPWYSRMVSFRKNEGDFGTNSQHPYLGYHSGYKAQIWLFSLSLQYEPLCQILWFSENMDFRSLLFVPVWCGISLQYLKKEVRDVVHFYMQVNIKVSASWHYCFW